MTKFLSTLLQTVAVNHSHSYQPINIKSIFSTRGFYESSRILASSNYLYEPKEIFDVLWFNVDVIIKIDWTG